jgi:myosin heavy subunit
MHHKEVRELRDSNNELNKSKVALSSLYEKLQDNYNQVNDKCNRLDTMYKELEGKSQGPQNIPDSRISSLTADLNTCQNKNLEFITAMASKDSTIASLENRLHDHEQSLGRMERLFVQQMALEPTWIKAGEVFTAFNDDVAIVVDEASDKNRCPSGSAATVHLNIGKDKKNLCLQVDRQEVFTYKGKKYFFSLLEVRENDQAHEYLVSILKERGKSLN